MSKINVRFAIAFITVTALWFNFSRHDEVWYNSWRSDNLNGYDFQEAPDYFSHLENRKMNVLVIQEVLILVSGLLLMSGLKKEQK
ncbi:MAG: hypothetical protein WC866_05470 [Patescibacteria group bacterium]|jgi:hypothetical protein